MIARKPRAFIGCEFSGRVRDAFIASGWDAWSCDLIATERPGPHYRDTMEHALSRFEGTSWDLLIAHPPCTRLTVAGARWFKGREAEQAEAIAFCEWIWALPFPRIALENPIGVLSTRSTLGKPTQIVQPWQFGHGEVKATCLWLKNLPKLVPTNIVDGRTARVHREPPGPERWKNRSRTYQGIADAMAAQWGSLAAAQASERTSVADACCSISNAAQSDGHAHDVLLFLL